MSASCDSNGDIGAKDSPVSPELQSLAIHSGNICVFVRRLSTIPLGNARFTNSNRLS